MHGLSATIQLESLTGDGTSKVIGNQSRAIIGLYFGNKGLAAKPGKPVLVMSNHWDHTRDLNRGATIRYVGHQFTAAVPGDALLQRLFQPFGESN